jgi:hypothetical protein
MAPTKGFLAFADGGPCWLLFPSDWGGAMLSISFLSWPASGVMTCRDMEMEEVGE